nr:PREDICTED: cell cycle and apoptosis regulator protein 2 isoform X2 [Latimeria chalumnae]|eukprot:XP_005992645.1 PREDICTED: cell cycle and apoptosis regulator protein 2 isoform X2 [Latimeria chalumnae]
MAVSGRALCGATQLLLDPSSRRGPGAPAALLVLLRRTGSENEAERERKSGSCRSRCPAYRGGRYIMSQYGRQKNLQRSNKNHGSAAKSGVLQPTPLLGPGPGLLLPPTPLELSQGVSLLKLDQGVRQRVITGVVTKLHDYFGVVDEDVIFQISAVNGRIPQVGEKVLVTAIYDPKVSMNWNAVKVQALSNQSFLKNPLPYQPTVSLGQKHGILGTKPQPLFQTSRVPSLFATSQQSALLQSPAGLSSRYQYNQRGNYDQRIDGRGDQRHAGKLGAKRGSEKPGYRIGSKERATKKARFENLPYALNFSRFALNSSYCDTMEVLRRYSNIPVPLDFFDARLCWVDSFPLSRPLSLEYPCHFHIVEREAETAEENIAELNPPDADHSYSAKVMLLSSPGIEGMCQRCSLSEDRRRERTQHPLEQIKFLMGMKGDAAVLIGGPWSPSLDGPNPERDPSVLVRTAIRCTKSMTGIDLSACTQWFRFAEVRYVHSGESAQVETVVIFLPDVWQCVPSLLEWEAMSVQHNEAPSDSVMSADKGSEETDKVEQDLQVPCSLPEQPAIIVHPNRKFMSGEFSCAVLTLNTLFNYRTQMWREAMLHSFEALLVSELFHEMLQRDFGFRIFKALLVLPEKDMPSAKPKPEKNESKQEDEKGETKESPGAAEEPSDIKEGTDDTDVIMKEDGKGSEQKENANHGLNDTVRTENEDDVEMKPEEEVSKETSLLSSEDILLLQEDEVDDFGVSLEDEERKSNASNLSELESGSLQEIDKELKTIVLLPRDVLLSFVYFDHNLCGYIRHKQLEELLYTLGLHLSKAQVRPLVKKVITNHACYYRKLNYSETEWAIDSLSSKIHIHEDLLQGNQKLLPTSSHSSTSEKQKTDIKNSDFVLLNGGLVHVGTLLEKLERSESSRIQMEKKIDSLKTQLGEATAQVAEVDAVNKSLTTELQELQKRLAETEEKLKAAEKLKTDCQRRLKENSKGLMSLTEQIQKLVNRTNSLIEEKMDAPSN